MACKLVFLVAVFGVASAKLPFPQKCEQVESQDTPTLCSNYKNIEDLDKIQTELQNDKAELEKSITELEAKVTQLRKSGTESLAQMKEMQSTNKVCQIAFSTSLVNDEEIYRKSGKDNVLVFHRVFTNKGRNYDPMTGIFTAKTRGLYFFTFSIYGNNAKRVGANLMKNGIVQVSVVDSSTNDQADGNTNSAVLQLGFLDRVYVELLPKSTVYDSLDGHTTFSGFLLFPW